MHTEASSHYNNHASSPATYLSGDEVEEMREKKIKDDGIQFIGGETYCISQGGEWVGDEWKGGAWTGNASWDVSGEKRSDYKPSFVFRILELWRRVS